MQEAQEPSQPRPALKRTPLPVLSAFFMIYIFVSGGSFGIEEMVSSSGPGLTLILLMALPFVWALPMALVASELGSALPGTGFHHWTRRALGRFWGFQAAWWWTLATLVDTSLYVVLAASYLQGYAGFGQDIFYLTCWSIIASSHPPINEWTGHEPQNADNSIPASGKPKQTQLAKTR